MVGVIETARSGVVAMPRSSVDGMGDEGNDEDDGGITSLSQLPPS